MKKIIISFISVILIINLIAGCISNSDSGGSFFDDKPSKKNNINDKDGDGVEDSLDAFPSDPSASKDSDGDGYPDSWNDGKNSLDSNSNLEIDEFPNNPSEWKDSDKDGVGDNKDINPDVDLSINFKITDFRLTSRVDILKWGQIYYKFRTNDQEEEVFDNGGDYWDCRLSFKRSIDFEYDYDIPDDGELEKITLEIDFFDHDIFLADDHLDICSGSGKTFVLEYDLSKNSISVDPNGVSEGSEGTIWYEVTTPNKVKYGREYSFEWDFKNKDYSLTLNIPDEKYNEYKNSNIDKRTPSVANEMKSFVNSDESIIKDLSNELDRLSSGFESVEKLNFILRFVHEVVDYELDSKTKNKEEFWRYPLETLVDGEGDCEDSSVLFASITDSLGFDTALLLYLIDDEDKQLGHLAVGIHLDENIEGKYVVSNGKKYYYCETAYDVKTPNNIFEVGDVPAEVKDQYADPYIFINV